MRCPECNEESYVIDSRPCKGTRMGENYISVAPVKMRQKGKLTPCGQSTLFQRKRIAGVATSSRQRTQE